LWRLNQSVTSRRSEVSPRVCAVGSLEVDPIAQSSISTFNNHSNTSSSSPALPSSPIAFDLNVPLPSLGPYDSPPILTPHHTDYRPDPAHSHDLDQLRLAALTELQRCVVETGEGFVDKMRDWETHRCLESTAHRGLQSSRSMMARRTLDPMDDSDDVMILDSASADEEVHFWDSPKKNTLSIGSLDDMDVTPLEETPSVTDDDTDSCSRDSMSAIPSSDAPFLPNTPSSYSDKAVSALTLALANGACGINDYQAVLDAYNHTHYGEESHVGELWD
jgi:hypothetical protein